MSDFPEAEPVLARLRRWWDETRDEAAGDPPTVEAGPDVGLYRAVECLTALRQEVKLLAKGLRGNEERSEATLVAMQAAIEQFNTARQAPPPDSGEAKALVLGLTEMDEALRRGRRVIETAARREREELSGRFAQARGQIEDLYKVQPAWRRLLCRPWHTAALRLLDDRSLVTHRDIFASLLEGYDLMLNRLQRILDEHRVIRMNCVGQLADPHCMTVVEAVADVTRPAGLVLEELRPGYYWKDQVLRYADVKVVGER